MKLSIELIEYLENMETWDSFRRDYKAIHKKNPAYANTFAGMLEICRGLNVRGTSYLIIGGLAVVSYIHQQDPESFRNWRGTTDIDLVVSDKKLAEEVLIFADYEYRQTQSSKIGVIGKLYDYAKEDNGETTVVGLRKGIANHSKKDITNKILKRSKTICVHGIGINVPQLKDLVSMKRFANRKKDRDDIKTLKEIVGRI